MKALAFISFGSFVAASFVVGLRLLAVAMRTGKTPELATGSAFFAGGGCGYGLIVLAFGLHVVPESMVPVVVLMGVTAASAGAVALAFGSWRIFRPADRWPLWILATVLGLLVSSLGVRVLHLSEFPASDFVFWTFTGGSCLSYGWTSYESLRFFDMLMRRIRIGLATPAMARRFLLWGIAGIGAVGMYLCAAANRFLDPSTLHPFLMLVQAAFGLTAAIGIWFAFFPPLRARRAAVSA